MDFDLLFAFNVSTISICAIWKIKVQLSGHMDTCSLGQQLLYRKNNRNWFIYTFPHSLCESFTLRWSLFEAFSCLWMKRVNESIFADLVLLNCSWSLSFSLSNVRWFYNWCQFFKSKVLQTSFPSFATSSISIFANISYRQLELLRMTFPRDCHLSKLNILEFSSHTWKYSRLLDFRFLLSYLFRWSIQVRLSWHNSLQQHHSSWFMGCLFLKYWWAVITID